MGWSRKQVRHTAWIGEDTARTDTEPRDSRLSHRAPKVTLSDKQGSIQPVTQIQAG